MTTRSNPHPRRSRNWLLLAFALLATSVTVLLPTPPTASATSGDVASPETVGSIDLSASLPGTTLYGAASTVSLAAANPTSVDAFNLSYSVVLPSGVSYVPGSTQVDGGASVDPTATSIEQGTVLVWSNVSDLLVGATTTIGFSIRHDTSVFVIGDEIALQATGAASADPRAVPDFDSATGTPIADAEAQGAAGASTRLSPFDLSISEPSEESELLRGVHDHRTVLTMTIENNQVHLTSGLSIVAHLPAGLEFLGCGLEDNTAVGAEEYPGSGRLDVNGAPDMANPCIEPSSTDTVTVDPDGAGPGSTDVHTRVEWDDEALAGAFGTADLAGAASLRFDVVAAVPLRSNVDVDLDDPVANLDNNTGPLTIDEQTLTVHGVASGDTLTVGPSVDEAAELLIAEDVSVHAAASTRTIAQGGATTWSLIVETSEYARSTGPLVVTDVVPDGLDVVDTSPSLDSSYPAVQPDGTTVLGWTLAGFATPSATTTITYDTVTRTEYRSTGAPVMARDGWGTTADVSAEATVLTGDELVTGPVGTTDDSGANQTADGPTVTKFVAAPSAPDGVCGDGTGLTFDADLATPVQPGDRVCWRLVVDFPDALDTAAVLVQDHLPYGFRYETHVPSTTDSVAALATFRDAAPLLEWELGDVDAGGQRFDIIVQTIVDDPAAGTPGDLAGNLLKVRHRNTTGSMFQYRDDAHASWEEPVVDLDLRVAELDGDVVSPAAEGSVPVEALDVATFEAVISNSGSSRAVDLDVLADLPVGLDCSNVTAVSDGGTCAGSRLEWPGGLGLAVDPGATLRLRFDVVVPAGVTAGVAYGVDAGVRTYHGSTNTGVPFRYVPANNVDATLTANTTEARDSAAVATPWPTVDITRSTSIDEAGNNAGGQATIGETISYSIDVALPSGTTFYGPAVISDDLGERVELVDGSLVASVDGAPLPDGWALRVVDDRVELVLADPHAVPVGGAQLIEVDFSVLVADVTTNARTGRYRNRVALDWNDAQGAARSQRDAVGTQIVEPNLVAAKTNDQANAVMQPGQPVTYDVTIGNDADAQVSVAHDVAVIDTVPDELTVLDLDGRPAVTGSTVDADGGRYDADEGTISWSIDAIDPGASRTFQYTVVTADPLVASTTVTNIVNTVATSLAGFDAGERTAESQAGGEGSGYEATATDAITAPRISVERSTNPNRATIGESVDHTLVAIVPANTVAYDIAVVDELDTGLRFAGLLETSCVTALGPCATDLGVEEVLEANGDVAFALGDITEPMPVDRLVTLRYRTVLSETATSIAGSVLTATATAHHRASDTNAVEPGGFPSPDAFDHTSGTADTAVTVVEPDISVDAAVVGQIGDADTRRASPGDTLTYVVTVANASGDTAGGARDITVVGEVDPRVVSFVDRTVDDGVTPIDADHTDGALTWSIAGPIAPGETVSITYDVTVPEEWDSSYEEPYLAELRDRFDVESYFGVDAATRARPDREHRRYTDVPSDTVRVELDLASIGDRVWFDTDRDRIQDVGETGAEGVGVTVVHYGADMTFGTADDELHETTTGTDGRWTVESLPGGRVAVLVAPADLPVGMTSTAESDQELVHPHAVWSGWLNQDQDLTTADAGFAEPPAHTGSGWLEGDPVTDSAGDVWVVGLKPDGRAFVRTRSPGGSWSTWFQQGIGDWASMTVNTDRAGNVWVVGVKNSGTAWVRTKDITLGVRDGWSRWVQQGSGGWASMTLSTDALGSVWLAGVKADGNAYVRTKTSDRQVDVGWSSWVHQGATAWSALTIATDTSANVWVAGVASDGAAFVRSKRAGGDVGSGWSGWARQGGSTGWVSMNIATDSNDNLWLAGVKESGTALVRMKDADGSIGGGWTSWHQLGAGNSWASMTLTVDDADTLWVAGVKHSGTAYIARKCFCPGISEGWSNWWQQGSVNSWRTLTISTDPSNRVMLAGLKLTGTAYVRIKGAESGVSTAWGNWMQQGSSRSWEGFEPHSNAWTGIQPPRTPTLGVVDVEWINPPGWTDATVSVNSSGTIYWC